MADSSDSVERANLIGFQRVMSTVGIEVWPGERFRQNYCSKRRPVQLSLAPVYFLKQTPGAQATPATTGTLTMISPSTPRSMYEDQPKCCMQTPSTFPSEWNKSLLIKRRLVSYGSSKLLCTCEIISNWDLHYEFHKNHRYRFQCHKFDQKGNRFPHGVMEDTSYKT